MQEFEVTYGGKTYPLDRPFFILATQNPIEQAGTYPLPEAQLDRFLLYVRIGYPSASEEKNILSIPPAISVCRLTRCWMAQRSSRLQSFVRDISISDDLIQYVTNLIRATRPESTDVAYVKDWVRWGSGPRAGQALILTAKARAMLKGRYAVTLDDIQAMAYPVLRHRVLVNFRAEAENIHADDVTAMLLKEVERPRGKLD